MKLIINIPDETVLKIITSIMENYPEASSTNAMKCTGFSYQHLLFDFIDTETGKKYYVDEKKLRKAFRLIFTDKWPRGCVQPPARDDWGSWDNWLLNCDNTSHDAFAQLATLGEVIYG
jgi:hypothetical protein